MTRKNRQTIVIPIKTRKVSSRIDMSSVFDQLLTRPVARSRDAAGEEDVQREERARDLLARLRDEIREPRRS